MAFLSDLGSVKLKSVPVDEKKDRSGANVELSGKDVLEDEAERWKYFFDSGCDTWFETLREHTFGSTFVELQREEARVIVEHWEEHQRLSAKATAEGRDAKVDLEALFQDAQARLAPLAARLDEAVQTECTASPTGLAFVKLSTRSPKDSKRMLAKAGKAYETRRTALPAAVAEDDNEMWKLLAEEVARAGAVATGRDGLELLLDSERVFEDLEFVLRGPKVYPTAASSPTPVQGAAATETAENLYSMSLVARAFDPRLTPQSEFRGIVWGGKLTCLGQYFHPLFFPELTELKAAIEADCRALFTRAAVSEAVEAVGGHCIVDFAWLGKGEVIIIELNPFDGVCLGTFPASTGMFLWDDEGDRAIMKGEVPFEIRVRTERMPQSVLKVQCNTEWRQIIYRSA